MAKWRAIPHIGDIESIVRRIVSQLNNWAPDKDRFEKVVSSPSDTSSLGNVALRQGPAIESSRVNTSSSGTLNPLSVTGSLIPTLNDSYNIGQPTPAKRWENLYLSRNADIDGNVDIAGTLLTTGTATFGSAQVSTGLTVTDHIQTANLTVTSGATFTGIVSGFSSAGGIAPNKANAATYLGRDPGGNGYDWDYISGNTCQFGLNAFDSTFAVNNKVIQFGEIISDPVLFLSGISSFSNFYSQGSLILDQPPPYGASINGVILLGGSMTIHGGLGVTLQTALAGGLTVSSGATFNGMVGMLGGLSVSGGPITLYQPGAASIMIVGVSTVRPATNAVQSFGTAPIRWANIFGRTGNFADTLTAGATCNLGGAGTTSTMTGSWQTTNPGDLTIRGNLALVGSFIPQADGTGQVGQGGPAYAANDRIGYAWINFLALGKGQGLTSGTVLNWNGDGNYADIYGVSNISGLSYVVTLAPPTAGTKLIFGFSNPSKMIHGNSINLQGGITFSGQTGDHISLISNGADRWREFSRWRASGQLFQPTGDNHPAGTAAIGTGGSVNVTCNLVGSSSMIHITGQSDSGTPGFYRVGSRTVGASFNILSSSSSDTSTVAWIVIEPEGL